MITAESKKYSITYGNKQIEFELEYCDRKTLEISVHPDLLVTVKAPQNRTLEEVYEKVRKKAPWIVKQIYYFESFLPETPPRRFVSGEAHYYLGKQYRLKLIVSDIEEVKLKNGYIYVFLPDRKDKQKAEKLLNEWYLTRAKLKLPDVLEKCYEKLRKYGVDFPEYQIRKMSKRWGSCTPEKIIMLNPDLIKAPSHCIEYVITHELCHLKYLSHDNNFISLLSRVMPDWELRKQRLERVKL